MNSWLVFGLLLKAILASASISMTTPTSALVSLAFCSVNFGVSEGFFGFFRRRTTPKTPTRIPSILEEIPAGPGDQGGFPFFQGNMFNPMNQFQLGGGGGMNFMQQQNTKRPPSSPFQGHSFQSGSFQEQVAQQMAQQNIPDHMQQEVFKQMQENPQMSENEFNPSDTGETPGVNAEEAESFFTLLAETDESQCISRLVCEMGADPVNSGEFGQTISEMIGNLRNFPAGSQVSRYNDILQHGVSRGLSGCSTKFSSCDDESLQLVKNAQVGER